MNITKYSHACLVIEKYGQSLVIDPGGLSSDFVAPKNTVAVVVTHEHFDHFDKDKLKAIIDAAPNAKIYAHESITSQIPDLPTEAVSAGTGIKVGNFELEFCGGEHAVVYPAWPVVANLGVMVNGEFYYPGDSFSPPNKPVRILALPVSAPWLKFSEAADFLLQVKPQIAFPTHDAILSDEGHELADRMFGGLAKNHGINYQRLPLTQLTDL